MTSNLTTPGQRVSKAEIRQFIAGLDHRLLRQLARDLLEFDFRLDAAEWPQWTAAAFVNGLRLAHCEPALAASLIQPAPAPLLSERESVLQWLRVRSPMADALGVLKAGFAKLAECPPPFLHAALVGRPPAAQLSRWFVAAAVWGMRAGLDGNEISVGNLIGLVDRLPLGQQFIGNRLVILARCSRHKQRRALVEMITYSYRRGSCERRVLTAAANSVLAELTRRGRSLDCAGWVLSGFRDGLMLSTCNVPLRDELLRELTPQARKSFWSMFENQVGCNPAGWSPERLVAIAANWLGAAHPHVATPNCRADEFERIRHVFDYGFWIGLAAGSIGKLGGEGGGNAR